MPTKAQLRALNRFGLGARPHEADNIAPRAWLLEQINSDVTKLTEPRLMSGRQNMAGLVENLRSLPDTESGRVAFIARGQRVMQMEQESALRHAMTTDAPFAERLVRFWSNHFAVSAVESPEISFLAGAYEREAIRPHVFGKFEDMVIATAQHPAMLLYLDQARSIGPNSPKGKGLGKGFNENYARELMELHTLGVDGGYRQSDVENLALIFTGWTVGGLVQKTDVAVTPFVFAPDIHEPGPKTLLGQPVPEAGIEEGLAAISRLVSHPSTAYFIATKLVRHFVSDTPDPRDVEALARVFYQTVGDLAEVTRALVSLETPFTTPDR